jgi:hypothetical protein
VLAAPVPSKALLKAMLKLEHLVPPAVQWDLELGSVAPLALVATPVLADTQALEDPRADLLAVPLTEKEKLADLLPPVLVLVVARLLALEVMPGSAVRLAWEVLQASVVPLVLAVLAKLEVPLEDQLAVPPVLEVLAKLADLQVLEDLLVDPLALAYLVALAARLELEGPLVHLVTSKEKTVSMEPLVLVLVLEPLARLEAPQASADLAASAVQLV